MRGIGERGGGDEKKDQWRGQKDEVDSKEEEYKEEKTS